MKQINIWKQCENCKGSKKYWFEHTQRLEECPYCEGTGKVVAFWIDQDDVTEAVIGIFLKRA